jgi:hypothetical protein
VQTPNATFWFRCAIETIGFLALPSVCVAYLRYRLPARRDQLTSLFKSDGILPAYLATRGHRISKAPGEVERLYRHNLEKEFDRVFALEFGQEYGLSLYMVPIMAASITTIVVVFFLIREATGEALIREVPVSLSFALLGAFAGNMYDVLSRYSRSDLNPTSLWWIPFRYLMAIGYGLLAGMIFSSVFAGLGSFVLGMISITEALEFVRSRVGLVQSDPQSPGFRLIQGLDAATIDTLADLGISHAQHLAYADPLKLLLRSNFGPNQLADWMDQCFLFNYLGTNMETLRPAGIRGGIEIADLQDLEGEEKKAMLSALSERLGINTAEANNLIEEFNVDAQLNLIGQIWGSDELQDEE